MKDSGLDLYFLQESKRRPHFQGQLTESFQSALANRFSGAPPDECTFTETVDLLGGETIAGALDLRGAEDEFLGGVKFWGKRVLQVLPGSGWLSAHIAIRADELVVLDMPVGFHPDMASLADESADGARSPEQERIRKSWWFVKNTLGYEAHAVYANLYDPPDDLGRFDVGVLSGVLSSLAHPYLALRNAAAMVDDTIVVVEPLAEGESPDASDAQPPSVLFKASAGERRAPRWQHAPAAIARMLNSVGFTDQSVSRHAARRGEAAVPYVTIVARRQRPGSGPGIASWSAAPPVAKSVPAPAPASPAAPAPVPAPAFHAVPPPSGPVTNAWDQSVVDELPLPTAMGRFLVAGTDDVEVFVKLGRNGFQALMSSLGRSGVDAGSLGRVLDFGSGVGRVLRYWHSRPEVEVHGTDLNADAIAWARDNLTFGRFTTNTLEPRLDHPDNYFGFAYALSVFTHLPVTMQRPWLAELLRVVRPGGHVYFTTHGHSYRHMLTPEMREVYDRGQLVVGGDENPGSNYCGAFHPPGYVRHEMLEPLGATLLEFLPEGALGNPTQDSWLIRKA